jgi:hypothetical protein
MLPLSPCPPTTTTTITTVDHQLAAEPFHISGLIFFLFFFLRLEPEPRAALIAASAGIAPSYFNFLTIAGYLKNLK